MKGTGHPWKIWLVKVSGMEGFGWTDVPDEHLKLGAAFGYRRTTREKALEGPICDDCGGDGISDGGECYPCEGSGRINADRHPPAIIWLAPSCSQCYGMDPDGRTWCDTPAMECEGKPDGSVCKAGCIPYERDRALDMELECES